MRAPPTPAEMVLALSSPAGFALAATGIPKGGRLWWRYPLQDVVNRWLVDMIAGRKRRIILNAPPRHGKSMLVAQYLPAWYLGWNPDHEVAIVSNTAELAEEHGGYARDLMLEHGERYFGLRVRGGKKAAANGWQIEGHRGRCHAIGKGGTFTGKGANLLIVDDPIKDTQEAQSPTARQRLWEWWTGVGQKRLNPGGSKVVVMFTRWHQDDLVGRLLEADGNRGRWHKLNVPAIAVEDDPAARGFANGLAEGEPYVDPCGREPGRALWPVMLDGSPGYPLDELEDMRSDDAGIFEAQNQGNPRPPVGAKFSRAHFRYARDRAAYFELIQPDGTARAVLKDECTWIGTGDMAAGKGKDNDPCSFLVGAVTPQRELIVIEVIAEKLALGDQWDWVRGQWEGYPELMASGRVGAEFKQGAHALFGAWEREVSEGRWAHELEKIPAVSDKDQRAQPVAAAMKLGRVYFLDRGAQWIAPFEDELLGFPTGRHDDRVDVLAYAWIYVGDVGGSDMIEANEAGTVTATSYDGLLADAPEAEPEAEPDSDDDLDEFAIVAAPEEQPRRRRGGGMFRR